MDAKAEAEINKLYGCYLKRGERIAELEAELAEWKSLAKDWQAMAESGCSVEAARAVCERMERRYGEGE